MKTTRAGTGRVPRVLIAADKFKGSLTAVQVAERVMAGLRRVVPGVEVEALPVADVVLGGVEEQGERVRGGGGRDGLALAVA
ncbi:glycerate kinase, partial [Streptomyces mirabilis]